MLLIGDSITRGYYPEVEERLKSKAVVARLTTSKSVGDPALLAEVGAGAVPDEVRRCPLQQRTARLRLHRGRVRRRPAGPRGRHPQGRAGAKLIWASTTPVRQPDNLEQVDPKTQRVEARNKIAATLMAKEKVPTDDLYDLVKDKAEWYSRDGTHFNAKGTAALGGQVADQLILAWWMCPTDWAAQSLATNAVTCTAASGS